MRNISISIFIFVFIFGCSNINKKQNDQQLSDIPQQECVSDSNMTIVKHCLPIDVTKIKKIFKDNVTSTILRKDETDIYFCPQKSGYYGKYTFLDYYENDKMKPIAQLIVFNDQKTWMYDNTSDVFIEVTVYDPNKFIVSDFQGSCNSSILQQRIEMSDKVNNELLIYKENHSNLIMLFKVSDNKVKWYKIGYYNDEIIQNSVKYIGLLEER